MIGKDISDVTFTAGRRLQCILQALLLVQSDVHAVEQHVGTLRKLNNILLLAVCRLGTLLRHTLLPFLSVAETLSGELISIVYKLQLPAVDSDHSPNVQHLSSYIVISAAFQEGLAILDVILQGIEYPECPLLAT